jgi:hypothetical protein
MLEGVSLLLSKLVVNAQRQVDLALAKLLLPDQLPLKYLHSKQSVYPKAFDVEI